MFAMQQSRRRGRLLVALILVLPLLSGWLLTSSRALAVNSGCRSDPVVILSNGTILDLGANIGTNLWDVQNVTYTLHGPQGTSVVLVLRTPDWPTTSEDFIYIPDTPNGVYQSDTIVYTDDMNVSVTATTSVGLGLHSAAGFDRQHLLITVSR